MGFRGLGFRVIGGAGCGGVPLSLLRRLPTSTELSGIKQAQSGFLLPRSDQVLP